MHNCELRFAVSHEKPNAKGLYSALRQLQNYLRSTMKQGHLNNNLVTNRLRKH